MQHACLTSLVLAGLLCCKKAAAACKNNFRIKRSPQTSSHSKAVNSTCSNSPCCSTNIFVHSHLLVKFQKHQKRCQKHLATSRNENAVQLRKHSVGIVGKRHAHGVEKRRQTSPQNVRTKNSFQIHLLSRLHQVQMNFTENEVLLQKVDVKHHHPKITKSPCFCIQIQMSSHRSASFPEFCPTVLSKTSKHSHHASYMQET